MQWSIVPDEVVFSTVVSQPQSRLLQYCGKTVVVRGDRIEALLSSDPYDFLDSRFMPGAVMAAPPKV